MGERKGNVEVVWVRRGMAWRVGGKVYVHEALRSRPRLLKKVLEHEGRHLPGAWTWQDWGEELRTPFDVEAAWFLLSHPSAWWQLWPWVRLGGVVYWERSVTLVWVLVVLLVVFCWSFLVCRLRGWC